MDKLEREYRHFPAWVGLIGGLVFAALLFGASWGLFGAAGTDIWAIPDPQNGMALMVTIGAGVVGMMLGWFASYADWLVIKRDTLWYACENISDRLQDARKRERDLEDLLTYIPESALEWARARRVEALTTPVAQPEPRPEVWGEDLTR